MSIEASLSPLYSPLKVSRYYGITGDSNSTFESYTDTSSVFSGQYFDDFSLPSQLRPHLNQKVLMLGLGLGSGVRPILASNQVSSVVGVDADPLSVAAAGHFFSEHFPELSLRIERADAFAFLKNTEDGSFDTIWIDLFDKDGFSSCLADRRFFEMLPSKLTRDGIVAINAFTIPVFLGMFAEHSPEARISASLKETFDNVGFFPYRRNITLLASNAPLENNLLRERSPLLNLEDFRILSANGVRAARGPDTPRFAPNKSSSKSDPDCLKFENINKELAQALSKLEESWREKGRMGGEERFLEIVKTRERACRLTDILVETDPGELKALTVAISLLINSCAEDFSWYVEKMLGLAEDPHRVGCDDLVRCHLPQLLSMTRNCSMQFNPERRYAQYQSNLYTWIKKCEDAK